MSENTPILEMRKINKHFPGVKALSDVDFRLFRGEVHAIMGQNGAGKSTLVKVLTGVYEHDSGDMLLEGKPIRPDSPLAAQKLGISTVYQEVNLCPNLSVAENIFVGRQPMRFGRIDWKSSTAGPRRLLAKLNVSIDVTQILCLVLHRHPADGGHRPRPGRLLEDPDPRRAHLEPRRDRGGAAVQGHPAAPGRGPGDPLHHPLPGPDLPDLGPDHHTEERGVRRGVQDRRPAEAGPDREDARQGAVRVQLRQSEAAEEGNREAATRRRTSWRVTDLGLRGSIAPFDLDLDEGDVLGLAGLLGSGRTEMARLLFGIDGANQGELRVKGKKTSINAPRSAMMAGMGFCSEDRKNEGVFAELTVRENIILALQATKGILRYIPTRKQLEIADELIKSLAIKTPSANNEAGQLSGGNQQKVMLARWLATNPIILILDEPTRGIDVGAKLEIMELILILEPPGDGRHLHLLRVRGGRPLQQPDRRPEGQGQDRRAERART